MEKGTEEKLAEQDSGHKRTDHFKNLLKGMAVCV